MNNEEVYFECFDIIRSDYILNEKVKKSYKDLNEEFDDMVRKIIRVDHWKKRKPISQARIE